VKRCEIRFVVDRGLVQVIEDLLTSRKRNLVSITKLMILEYYQNGSDKVRKYKKIGWREN